MSTARKTENEGWEKCVAPLAVRIHRGIPRLNRVPITQVVECRSEDLGSHS